MNTLTFTFDPPDGQQPPLNTLPDGFTHVDTPGDGAEGILTAQNSVYGPYFGGTAPSDWWLLIIAQNDGGKEQLSYSVEIADGGGTVDFDWVLNALDGDFGSFVIITPDGVPHQLFNQGSSSDWAHVSYPLDAGTSVLIWEYDKGPNDPSNGVPGFGLDNVVLTNTVASSGGGGGGGTPGPSYKRGDWLKHLGGVYIARVDGPTTEPGPGDTDDWFEVAPRTPTLGFTYEQSTPASRWIVPHPLTFYPAATVVDTAGQGMEGDVSYPDAHTVQIDFSAAFSGTVYLS